MLHVTGSGTPGAAGNNAVIVPLDPLSMPGVASRFRFATKIGGQICTIEPIDAFGNCGETSDDREMQYQCGDARKRTNFGKLRQ
jgi:hypothetical protein